MELTSEKERKSLVAPVIFFCFLLSGLSSLIYEVLWMRMLILIFGSTTFAISTVLTAFMGLLLFAELPYLFLVLYRSCSDSRGSFSLWEAGG